MKMKNKFIITSVLALGLASCSQLEEKLQGDITFEDARKNADISNLLKGCYNSFRGPFQDQTGVFCLQDMSTDVCIGPTRGGDWDDNGVWRVLHQQTWNAENQRIRENFNNLSTIVFNTTNLLNFNPSDAIKAEALMLRAYAMFYILDLYDQVPFRDPGENLLNPSQVLKGTDALDKIIADLNTAIPNLGNGPASKANKWAAKALLMKCYLNRGVYSNRATPTFAAADMTQVITLGNEITASGQFSLAPFFNNFKPNNTQISPELIFANENTATESGNVRFHWHASQHYNQNPSGWNGFTTLASFYDKFEASDVRRGDSVIGFSDQTGMRVGLLYGQQYDKNGNKLKDRSGNDLFYSRDISSIVTGNVETPGIRVVKYVPDMKADFSSDKDVADNDMVLLRYADVLLMVAEAQFRSGNTAGALATVNTVRAQRGASNLGALTLDILLDERGRELYWEAWRRNDMVRFGKFLAPFGTTKPGTSDAKYLIFPIPTTAIAGNPNLTQNPGY
ncbi:MAG: RagB/SusD family nutrient uptake outer membrane protein [Chitinophagaceae bacterium]|nr:RagB/SusD family nutrient uptake outer membrane protein [Chitinophagaceae bacterium]MBN8665998.1 RagB/SusD family nutrient uptake outer membrane protein [Chitinophagales bacterium]